VAPGILQGAYTILLNLYWQERLSASSEDIFSLAIDQRELVHCIKLFDINFSCLRALVFVRQDNVCKDTVCKQTSKVPMKGISESFGVVRCLQDTNTYPSGKGIDTNDSSHERDALAILLF
jgi:hypothetical protein